MLHIFILVTCCSGGADFRNVGVFSTLEDAKAYYMANKDKGDYTFDMYVSIQEWAGTECTRHEV